MTNPFVWFDNLGPASAATTEFMSTLFGWTPGDMGGMSIVTARGADRPFAAMGDTMGQVSGWVPYVEVTDLAAETQRARDAGGTVLAEDMAGPAGRATFVQDPGGAVLALWTRADTA
ncbi:VOC family protein [uncultured Tateyamaria sp.]|uniref:VOC family protein n=1 Tax=Tateyamaria sp. 1078 TaxID=3417464 RepID=UPI00261B727D|nr:VOC family protein [uncultured Tateyamaria sp.]